MDPAKDSFDSLRSLLALKRHEQPPPGYFDRLPDLVRHRLALDEEPEPEDWFAGLFDRLRLRPAVVGFVGFALGAFYLAGLGYSGRVAQGSVDGNPLPPHPMYTEARIAPGWEPRPATTMTWDTFGSSVSPIIQAGPAAPFAVHRDLFSASVQRARYTLPPTSR